MSNTATKIFVPLLTAALVLTGAAVCAAAAAQKRPAKRNSSAAKKSAAKPAQPASDSASATTTPAADPPAKRNVRAPEKNETGAAAPATTRPAAEEVKKPAPSAASKTEQYVYEFEQPEFVVNRIRVEHDAAGRGRITFERRSYVEPMVEPFELSPAALGRVRAHWEALRFLESETNYQSERHYAHMGTVRLKMRAGGRERAAEFNHTEVADAQALALEYRRAADQAIFVFDVKVARENQPLETPKLFDTLDRMIKLNMISDPAQLVPLLRELQTDERLPLITRNHVARLLKKLDKPEK